MPGDTTTHTRDITLDTYRYLRGGIAVMVVMLGAAVIGERLTATCWQTSISAYYFTTAHSIFIAALGSVGVTGSNPVSSTQIQQVRGSRSRSCWHSRAPCWQPCSIWPVQAPGILS
jgi:hypothetical protein